MVLRECAGGGSGISQATIYFNQGQMGELFADELMVNQPRFVTPSGYTIQLVDVYVTLGKAGTTQTSLQASILNDTGDGSAPAPGSPTSTLNVPSGNVYSHWVGLEGTTLTSEQHLQTRIDVPGSGAQSLVIHFWGHTSR